MTAIGPNNGTARGVRVRWRRPQGGDAGITLVELLVAMVILLIVGSVVASGLIATLHTQSGVDTDSQIQAGVQRAGEQLSRDLRDARSVITAAPATVTVWDDTNFDYVKQTGETVTWATDTSTGALRLCRSDDAGHKRCIPSSSKITSLSLAYHKLASGNVGSVDVTLTYQPPKTSSTRSQQWSVTLRNAS
jgi:type II secretory pathway pseudopilin PulG